MQCPVCGNRWTGVDPIALIGRIVVTLGGAVQLGGQQAWLMRLLMAHGLKVPRAEVFIKKTPRQLNDAMRHTNNKLKRVGWRIRSMTMSNGEEVLGLTEILRNEAGRLKCKPAKITNER